MPTVKRHKHKRPVNTVVMQRNPPREDSAVRVSTKGKQARRIVAFSEDDTTCFELHSTKGYRSQSLRKPTKNNGQ